MRPLLVATFVSLDGVMQAPGGPEEDPSSGFTHGGWTVPYFTDDLGADIVESFGQAEDFLLGRTTYELFAGYWPTVTDDRDPVATAINTLPKHVASRTLDKLDWDTADLLEGDVVEAVRALKATDGGELQVHGSAGLIQTLLAHDLVDTLRLMVFPVVLGDGKRLFGDGATAGAWRLVSSVPTDGGVLVCTYQRAGELQTGSFAPDA